MTNQCRATTKAGNPCRGRVHLDGYCIFHQDDRKCAHSFEGEGCSALAGDSGFCPAHEDPNMQALRMLEGRRKNLEKAQRRNPPPQFIHEGWMEKPAKDAAEYFEVETNNIYRWRSELEYRAVLAEIRKFKERHPDVHVGGIVDLPKSHFDWTEEHIPLLLTGFIEFRKTYFLTPDRKPYGTPGFQKIWATTILKALVTGGREMILAPVRHGKTQLLTQLMIYLWCLDPNLRVLWVSVTQGIAEKPVAQMRSIYMSNQKLISDYAHGGTFEPPVRDPRKWTNSEFTLATRTDYDINGPNVKALGRGGSILSLNADIIIVDDIEDQKSVSQLGTRDSTKEWWITQLGSRKEEHTGLFVIGSRQHPDDLYSSILNDPGWHVIVEQAHDPTCAIEGDDGHWDCLLFPEVRTYKWLMEQKREADKINPAYFELSYQNVSRIDGLVVFPEDEVKACRVPTLSIGQVPKPREGEGTIELVAGLDPAISGFQAAILLAYQTHPELKIWLVDLDNTEGGGVTAAASIMRKWYEAYGNTSWVVESNLLGYMSEYSEIKDYTSRHGIFVQNWRTDSNKNSQFFGVTSLAQLFRNRIIQLPYADNASKGLTDRLVSQLVVWDESNSRNKNRTGFKDDLVMALWFAWDPIRRNRQEWAQEAERELGAYEAYDIDDIAWASLESSVW